ncbi:vacuolar protein sorting 13 homolog B [Nesidiocoris tenuis]|uniref:Vacuolar protein sorting 13 homolog B n=1 Tax=Nesidiocoris tenuis TaxID=355587 RepID=A0ABN7BG54_9HEMI|nr:vacuolar protein sorting 13 homolog B [Nesidiocoris tenuis]
MLIFLILAVLAGFVYYRRRDTKIIDDLSSLGKWAVVTGATDGIGKAFAFELARKGFNVALISRSKDKLDNVAKEIENQCSVSTKVVPANFTSINPEMYARIGDELRGLDVGVLVNNVGTSSPHPDYFVELEKHHSYVYQDILNCNISSVVQMTRILLPGMIERKRGLVVNVSSGFSAIPAPLLVMYGATKSFITKFSQDLDIECRDKGVHVHVLLTGRVATKHSGVFKINFFTPSPDTYAKSALEKVLNHRVCTGYIGHQIIADVGSLIGLISPGFSASLVVKQFSQSYIFPARKSIILGVSATSGSVNFPSLNQIYGTLSVEAIVVSICRRTCHIILNPWSLTITGSLAWEPWISCPLLTVQLTSDILALEYSPKHIACFLELVKEFQPLIVAKTKATEGDAECKSFEVPETSSTKSDEEDQYYKDDLQAGAFQFVNTDPQPDLPLAYQVVFPSQVHMAWAYPQPRCISSITVLPVPFDYPTQEGVSISLQYLDFLGWKDWIKFKVYETKIVDVDLPQKPQVASTWRVIVKESNPPLHVQALAASLRVDSMFSPKLVPNVRLNVTLDSLQISAWAGPSRVIKLPPPLSRFAPDNPLPGEYPFAKMSIEHVKLRVLSWATNQLEVEGDFRGRVDVVNCKTLREQCVVQPFPAHVNFETDPPNVANPKYSLAMTAGPILAYVSPSIGHTISAAVNNAVLMPVVLCNDTCFPVRIGQVGTNENITIQCLQCHFYAWRSTQQDMELKFSLSLSNDKLWSRPVATWTAGSIPLVLIDDNGKSQNVIIVIKKLSSTMTQVLISGELVVHNNLERSIDVRLVANSITERQRYVTVNPSSRAPSIVLTPDTKYNIRLGLQSQWSGLVPLFATSNSWLVKVPTKEKKDFISVWCQIFKEKEPNKRILIVISPMYLIKSLLPCDANVLIKTEELNVDKSLKVPGRGCISNLITPGTTAHNHSLTFHIDGNLPSSSPHVPLSYSAMDGRTPPLPPIPDVESLIDRSEAGPASVPWPFLGPQWVKVLWRHANQPDTITHVKVRFCGDKLKVANSLMVELQPWALVINTLGLSIALQSTGRFLCALQHFCVLAPPPIEGTFYLLVELNDGYHKSTGLQLSDNQSFYKPQISGLIPLSDSVQIKVQAPNSVIFATMHSKIMSGIRILHVSSSYVISNLSGMDLSVAAFSVRKDAIKFRLPSEILYYAVHLPKNSSNNIVGEPLAEWHEIGHGDENGRRLYLIFERSGLVSNPVPLTLGLERSTATALLPVADGNQVNICLEIVFQTKDNVVYITVDRQDSPQLLIHNRTRHLLTVAKSSSEQGGAAEEESEDWEWRFMLPAGKCGHYKCDVPNMSAALPPVVVARPDQNYWSTAISLVPSSGSRLVNLPQGQDLTATVLRIGYTIHLILAHASHSLIAASDVRSRLSINSQQDLLKDTTLAEASDDSPDQIKVEDASECEDLEKIKVSVLSRFDLTCFLHGVTFMLCSEPEGSFDWREVAALTVDNVGITAQPVQNPDSGVSELAARITIWDVQIDNQEFHRGSYDFSVVLLRQGELDRSLFTGHNPHHLVETARVNSPAVDVSVLLNTNVRPVIQEVSVKAAPLQLYIEDEYLIQVNNHLTNLIPSLLIKGERRVMKKQVSPAKSSISASTMSSKATKTYLGIGSKECSSAEPVGSADKGAKVEIKTAEEEQDLFYVSDEEMELPVSYSPWKSASEQHKGSADRVADEDDDERYEILWSDDGEEEPALKIPIPDDVVSGTYDLSRPLKLKKFLIAPMEMSVSVHTSTKFYIALDQSPLSFSEFRRTNVVTTPFRLGHALSLHYFLGAIYGTGWALGSLQLLGAPAGLARSVGHGLKNFVTFPYEGFMEGPTGFLFGIMHGSASLMKHITAGTLSSVNKLAGSWSRTLDRLTLSPDDLRYAEEMRRIKPQGIADGIRQGLTEFGVSFLGGVGGLAQQPLEYATGGQGKSLVGSLGRGLVGVMARPISGAAELVALTAHGILSGAGWADIHIPKHQPVWQGVHQGAESRVKYEHKLVPKNQSLLFVCEATSTEFEPVVLVVTSSFLYVLNREDVIVKQLKLQDIAWSKDKFDPTMLTITVQTPDTVAEKLSQKRITEFVRESRRALNSVSSDRSFAGQSASLPPTPPSSEQDPLKFFLNPQRRDHFVCILDLAARHASTKGFPVLT